MMIVPLLILQLSLPLLELELLLMLKLKGEEMSSEALARLGEYTHFSSQF